MSDDYLRIELSVFEGPFDLLLHLIRENEIDIYDIPIAKITDQYLEYLQKMEEMDLEIASSFLVMAATLLSIKAKMLLPRPETEGEDEAEDAREELVHDLLEYMRFKEAAKNMSLLREAQIMCFARDNTPELYENLFSEENPLDGKTLLDLQNAFTKVLDRAKEKGLELIRIEREQVTLRDRIEYLYHIIQENPKGIAFSDVFTDCQSKVAFIVTFLALLELVRQGVLTVVQSSEYGEIYLHLGDLTKYERDALSQS